jgi:hypothetical protein
MKKYKMQSLVIGATDVISELPSVEMKLNGIAHLLQAANTETVPLDTDMYGLGLILRSCSAEINKIRNEIETESLKATLNKKV